MTDDRPPPSLEELDTRLREARRAAGMDPIPPEPGYENGGSSKSDMGVGMRVGLELLVGVGAGALLGYGIDNWLGTKPWGMIIMFLVGAVAGFMNVYRLANRQGYAAGFDKSRIDRDGGE